MARARNIKPGFFTNEELVELPFATRLLFIGLWTIADREGRLEDKPKRIKMHLFPADDIDIDGALNALQTSGFVRRYQAAGAQFIQVLAFRKHQNPHKDEKASLIPAPGGHDASTVQAPCEYGGNPADSPIPDSLPLNPDSPIASDPAGNADTQASPVAGDSKPARADDELSPSVLLSIAMRRAGIDSQPADPRVMALAEQGVLPETVAAACAEAKAARPGERIGVAYIVAILQRWSKDATKVNAGGANLARAGPQSTHSVKFDPVAHVNRNRKS